MLASVSTKNELKERVHKLFEREIANLVSTKNELKVSAKILKDNYTTRVSTKNELKVRYGYVYIDNNPASRYQQRMN